LNENGKPNYAKITILNNKNKEYLCQPVASELGTELDNMPAGWWTIIELNALSLTPVRIDILNDSESQMVSQNSPLQVSEVFLSNNISTIKINHKNGAFIELISENVNDGSNLLNGSSSNLTFGYLDDDKRYPAWNLTPEYWEHPLNFSNEKDVQVRIKDVGPIFSTLEITKTLGISPVSQTISIFKSLPEIFLQYNADWKQKNILLKILYSTSTKAEIITADAIYSIIEHKTNPEVPCDKARYEKICHNFIDLSTPDNKWGLALINEGKYAFDVNEGDMRLTLLRSCRYPPSVPEAWVNMERQENEKRFNHKVPEFSGLGSFKCRYVLLPHSGGTLVNSDGSPNMVVRKKSEEFNKPITLIPIESVNLDNEQFLTSGDSLFEIEPSNVYLGALKLNEWDKNGNIVVRFFETCGNATSVKITFNPILAERITAVRSIDLLERESHFKFDWNNEDLVLSFQIGKFELVNFKLIL
jgi:alpha-mannosidase